MLARIINELAGLDVSSEDEQEYSEDEFGELQSATTPRDTADAAHLTASTSSAAATPLPPHGLTSSSSSSSLQQQQRSPLEPQNSGRRNRWSTFINGAKRVIDNIIDVGDEDQSDRDTSPDRQRSTRQQQQHPGASTAGFPTVRRGSFPNSEVDLSILGDTTPPTLLQTTSNLLETTAASTATTEKDTNSSFQALPQLSEPSNLMEDHHIRGLLEEIPLRYRQSPWKLVYSTQRDGISMQTMLRNARNKSPTVLVVRDMGKAIFGAFCSEPWKVSTRYYGTGETFVFQLHPREAVWHWWWKKGAQQQNDYFMWGSQEAVAVGGAGGYALWLDSELSTGISRNSITFGNDSLSSSEEFRIGAVELWWLE